MSDAEIFIGLVDRANLNESILKDKIIKMHARRSNDEYPIEHQLVCTAVLLGADYSQYKSLCQRLGILFIKEEVFQDCLSQDMAMALSKESGLG